MQRVGLGQLAGHRAGDRDLQAVEDPRGAEPEYQPGVERRPAQPVQPGRDGAADRLLLLFRRDGGHAEAHPSKATITAVMLPSMPSCFPVTLPPAGFSVPTAPPLSPTRP